jgi:hypothetical protein
MLRKRVEAAHILDADVIGDLERRHVIRSEA